MIVSFVTCLLWNSVSSAIAACDTFDAVCTCLFAAVPTGDVRVAEEHLDALGPIGPVALQHVDSLLDLRQPRVELRTASAFGTGDPVERGGNVEKFTANFEVNAVEDGARRRVRGHGGVPRVVIFSCRQ